MVGNDIARPIQLSGSIEIKIMVDMISGIGFNFTANVRPNPIETPNVFELALPEKKSFAAMTDSMTDDSVMFRACGYLCTFRKTLAPLSMTSAHNLMIHSLPDDSIKFTRCFTILDKAILLNWIISMTLFAAAITILAMIGKNA